MRSITQSWLLGLTLAALCAAALAGCASWPDTYEARTCRQMVPALNPSGSTIEVLGTRLLRDGRVGIVYAARGPNTKPAPRTIVCAFSRDETIPGDRLVSVWSDGKQLGDIRLTLLKRFWLKTQDAAVADPEPFMRVGSVPELPRWLAYALQHLLSALPLISIYALLAAAYALVYGLVGRINLAFGEFAAIGGYGALLAFAITGTSAPWWMALTACFVVGMWSAGMHGLIASRLIFSPLRNAGGQHLLIATIGLAIFLQEYLRLTQGTALRWIEPILNQPVGVARSASFIVMVTPMAVLVTCIAVVAASGLLLMMRWTRFGRYWRACADDSGAAMLAGVDPSRILLTSIVLATALAGVAGTISTVFYGGLGYAGGIVLGLKALIAAIAGGIGSVPGALVGGILIGSFETLWSALFPIEYRDLAVYGALVALLIWRPQGVLGDRYPAAR